MKKIAEVVLKQVLTTKTRLKTPVPSIIKKIQLICGCITAVGAVVSEYMVQFPEMNVPSWVPAIIVGAGTLNHIILQLTTHDDFVK
jgi:Na+/glutamate symporter